MFIEIIAFAKDAFFAENASKKHYSEEFYALPTSIFESFCKAT